MFGYMRRPPFPPPPHTHIYPFPASFPSASAVHLLSTSFDLTFCMHCGAGFRMDMHACVRSDVLVLTNTGGEEGEKGKRVEA